MFAHKFAAPLLAGVAVAAAALALTTPAGAQTGPQPEHRVATVKKKPAAHNQIALVARPPTRVTVRRRSYLDPGTETRTHAEHSLDYAFPPGNQTFTADPNNPAMNWTRRPFPDCFDLPGFCQPW